MKPFLRVLFFLLISTKLFSQSLTESKVIFLDSSWIESTAENYKYIRIIEDYYSNKKSYVYKDYYKSKAVKAIGTSIDKDIIKPDGQFVTFYENGNKKSIVTFTDKKKSGKDLGFHKFYLRAQRFYFLPIGMVSSKVPPSSAMSFPASAW